MKVVVVGGGFGGLSAVRALKDVDTEVTLIDRRNFHLFQPLLYQVATGALSPAHIAAPLRSILRKQDNARVVLGEVTVFDLENRRVILDGRSEDYDVLIVSTGSAYNYFGRGDWEALAPSLKTIEEATAIRTHILNAFEQAEVASDPAAVRAWLTFVVIGGGPTGVELAGAIAEVARFTLNDDFSQIRPADAHVVLIEAEARVLPAYPPSLSEHARLSLEHLGAEVRLDTRVTAIDGEGVTVSTTKGEERIEARTVLWAAGVAGTPTGRTLAEAAGVTTTAGGRLAVTPQLTLPGRPEVFVIGDLAYLEQDGKPLPALAPVAIQQGAYVAKVIAGRLAGEPEPSFRYKDRGVMATIGRSAAVADLGRIRLHGFIGWLAWLVIHLMMLVRFESKVSVFLQWMWTYFTHGRSARLITASRRQPTSDNQQETQ
jgi:NADH:quinone reductase (non-electrogenic)